MQAPPPEGPRAPSADGAGTTGHADGRHDGTNSAPAGAPADAQMRLLLADLRRRLGPACRDWSEDAFESLIREVALRKVRWGDEAKRH